MATRSSAATAFWSEFCVVWRMTILRSKLLAPLVLTSLVMSLDSCRVVGGIFKAGVWVGVISVFLVVALVIWVARAIAR